MSVSATAWLATADPDPAHYSRWTESTRSVMLPAGRIWDAVKVPSLLGLHIVGPAADQAPIAGPCHLDPVGGTVYFLVPVGTPGDWPPGVEYLGDTAHICTPAIGVTSGHRPYWLQEPDGSGALVDPDELREALSAVGIDSVL